MKSMQKTRLIIKMQKKYEQLLEEIRNLGLRNKVKIDENQLAKVPEGVLEDFIRQLKQIKEGGSFPCPNCKNDLFLTGFIHTHKININCFLCLICGKSFSKGPQGFQELPGPEYIRATE